MPKLLEGRAPFVGWFGIDGIDRRCFFSKDCEEDIGSDGCQSMEGPVGAWLLHCLGQY
jgi:hypothetical protein